MEDKIRDLSEKMEEMKLVAESVQEMKSQMTQLMQFMRAGKMPEEHPPVEDPQFPPGFAPPYYQQAAGPSSQGRARVQSNQHYPFVNPGKNVNDPVIIPEPDETRKKDAQESIGGVESKQKETEIKQKWESLEERLRVVEGVDMFGVVNTSALCLVTDVVIPPKFKAPEFEKFDAKSCPSTHLTMYARKMSAHTQDDKLLIHFFQDSLSGNAASWYVKLDRTKIRTWKDLANAFVNHYKYLMEMAPSRIDLQSLEKRNNETFKGYAQRWRDLAARVQPPLSENELETLFISTLKAPYYERLIGHTSGSFSHLVIAGERIDEGIKKGKIPDSSVEKKNFGNKNEGEAHVVGIRSQGNYRSNYHSQYPTYPYLPHSIHQPRHPQIHSVSQGTRSHNHPSKPQMTSSYNAQPGGSFVGRRGKRNNPKTIEPIPMSYSELLPKLIENHQISLKPSKPLQPPYPEWYDLNARCDYHIGSIGHSTDDCTDLKRKVQALRDAKWLNFSESSVEQNVESNIASSSKAGLQE